MKYTFYFYNGIPTKEDRDVKFAGEGVEVDEIDFSSDTDAALYALDVVASNKVPLIIVDGKNNPHIDHTAISHASLGVILQYLNLSEYKYSKFNVNPFNNKENNSEILFGYDFSQINKLQVKHKSRLSTVIMNGNDTVFEDEKNQFSDDEVNDILGYISWFRD